MTDDLLAACVASRDDDAPRLAWAKSIGGERGEFVELQCALARGDLTPSMAGHLRRRQRDLLVVHGAQWSGLHGIATHVLFHRGFAEAAEIDCGRFVDEADAIFARAPLLSTLTATGLASKNYEPRVAMPTLERLLRSPAIRRLDGLFLDEAQHTKEIDTGRYDNDSDYEFTSYGDTAVRLADELGVHHLRAFGSRSSSPFRALRETTVLRSAMRLRFEEGSADDITALLAPQITQALIALDVALPLDGLIPHLPARLRELHVQCSSYGAPVDVHLPALAARCPDLECLSLDDAKLLDPSLLHAFGRLRSLSLRGGTIHPHVQQLAAIERFVATPLPTLRELVLAGNLQRPAIDAILAAYGNQLELLDFDGNGNLKGEELALESRFAGVVRAFSFQRVNERPTLFHTSRDLETSFVPDPLVYPEPLDAPARHALATSLAADRSETAARRLIAMLSDDATYELDDYVALFDSPATVVNVKDAAWTSLAAIIDVAWPAIVKALPTVPRRVAAMLVTALERLTPEQRSVLSTTVHEAIVLAAKTSPLPSQCVDAASWERDFAARVLTKRIVGEEAFWRARLEHPYWSQRTLATERVATLTPDKEAYALELVARLVAAERDETAIRELEKLPITPAVAAAAQPLIARCVDMLQHTPIGTYIPWMPQSPLDDLRWRFAAHVLAVFRAHAAPFRPVLVERLLATNQQMSLQGSLRFRLIDAIGNPRALLAELEPRLQALEASTDVIEANRGAQLRRALAVE